MTVHDIIERTIDREGGYVNDPADPGGETNYGISKRSYPALNIRELSRQRAHDIYLADYYIPSQVSIVPESLREIYFDMVVHMGGRHAVKVLQRAVNDKGEYRLVVDGILGLRTLSALRNLEPERVRRFRLEHYARLVRLRPSLARFANGWRRRAMEC